MITEGIKDRKKDIFIGGRMQKNKRRKDIINTDPRK